VFVGSQIVFRRSSKLILTDAPVAYAAVATIITMAVTATATTASATITTVANTITTTAVSRDAVTVPRSPNVTHSTASSKLDYSNSAAALLINEISAANDKNDDAQNQQKPEAVAETSTANSKSILYHCFFSTIFLVYSRHWYMFAYEYLAFEVLLTICCASSVLFHFHRELIRHLTG
jgi:hypothetical protein